MVYHRNATVLAWTCLLVLVLAWPRSHDQMKYPGDGVAMDYASMDSRTSSSLIPSRGGRLRRQGDGGVDGTTTITTATDGSTTSSSDPASSSGPFTDTTLSGEIDEVGTDLLTSISPTFFGLLDVTTYTITSLSATSTSSTSASDASVDSTTTTPDPTSTTPDPAASDPPSDPEACAQALASVSKVSCAPGNSLSLSDWLNLVGGTLNNTLGTNGGPIPDPYPLNALSSIEFGSGSTQFCTENDFISQNTHLPLKNAAEAAIAIACQCCTTSACGGGEATIKGDSGLSLITKVKSTSEECGGSLQFNTETLKDILEGVEDVVKFIQKVAAEVEKAAE
ncbi:hypothetical protein LTR56_011405 [Elasticomyces elasticus]|nr:hypothetical protein LTR56_011405 [Elasticomyces elasticus]KAK5760029.1 hypothetical protein LTS12_009760 [Elasticomyces elasticus]